MIAAFDNAAAHALRREMRGQAKTITRATRRLSTGRRLNSAADEPAGVAAQAKLRAARATGRGVALGAARANGIAAAAESALSAVADRLAEVDRLLLRSADTTLPDAMREANQAEIDRLINGVDGILQSADYRGRPLFRAQPTGVNPPPPIQFGTAGDVGAVAAAGNSQNLGGGLAYELTGSGRDIWNRKDEFHFRRTAFAGDGSITVRVGDITNPGAGGLNGWAKAGIMWRASDDANAAFFMAMRRPDGRVAAQWRATAGQNAGYNGLHGTGDTAKWLRVTRSGDDFTAEWSDDGTSWATMATRTIDMPDTARAGLSMTSHRDGRLATATFDNVAVQSAQADAAHQAAALAAGGVPRVDAGFLPGDPPRDAEQTAFVFNLGTGGGSSGLAALRFEQATAATLGDGFNVLSDLAGGGELSLSNRGGWERAARVIDGASRQIDLMRGRAARFASRLADPLAEAARTEAIQLAAAESSVADADVAAESAELALARLRYAAGMSGLSRLYQSALRRVDVLI